jgi:hypothetical protein
MTEPEPEEISRSRRKFVGLVLIAFVPIFIAYFAFFYFPDIVPTGTTNQGELITPPIAASEVNVALDEQKSWALIQPASIDCDEACGELLYLSRQVVVGLNKDSGRVKRIILVKTPVSETFADLLQSEHADVSVIKGTSSQLDEVSSTRPILYLMDPNGNILIYYTLETAGKPMLKDLKHLLRISNIG